jgi:hypothetical protein
MGDQPKTEVLTALLVLLEDKTNDFLFEGLKQGNAFPYPKQW